MKIKELKILHAVKGNNSEEESRTEDIEIQVIQFVQGDDMSIEFLPGFVKISCMGK